MGGRSTSVGRQGSIQLGGEGGRAADLFDCGGLASAGRLPWRTNHASSSPIGRAKSASSFCGIDRVRRPRQSRLGLNGPVEIIPRRMSELTDPAARPTALFLDSTTPLDVRAKAEASSACWIEPSGRSGEVVSEDGRSTLRAGPVGPPFGPVAVRAMGGSRRSPGNNPVDNGNSGKRGDGVRAPGSIRLCAGSVS